MEHLEEFVEDWMKKCNPFLILRYWRSKGSPGKCTLLIYGVSITHTLTPFGELGYISR